MRNKIICICIVALTVISNTVAFAGDVGGRPIKLSIAPPIELTEVYIEERLEELTTSTEALE